MWQVCDHHNITDCRLVTSIPILPIIQTHNSHTSLHNMDLFPLISVIKVLNLINLKISPVNLNKVLGHKRVKWVIVHTHYYVSLLKGSVLLKLGQVLKINHADLVFPTTVYTDRGKYRDCMCALHTCPYMAKRLRGFMFSHFPPPLRANSLMNYLSQKCISWQKVVLIDAPNAFLAWYRERHKRYELSIMLSFIFNSLGVVIVWYDSDATGGNVVWVELSLTHSWLPRAPFEKSRLDIWYFWKY